MTRRSAAAAARVRPEPLSYTLCDALTRLDAFLAEALPRVEAQLEPAGAVVALRGLHITPSDARALLTANPMALPALGGTAEAIAASLRADHVFNRLVERHALDTFELVTMLLALAPEIDLRYEKVFGYLQDDVTRRRPTIGLILSLLCPTGAERHARRATFAAEAPLRAQGLIDVVADPNFVYPPLLAQYVVVDEHIVRFLLGDASLDSRLSRTCRLSRPARSLSELHLPGASARELIRVREAGVPIWLSGPAGVGKSEVAAALAHDAGATLLTLEAGHVAVDDHERMLRLALRDADLRGAWLLVDHADHWASDASRLAGALRATALPVVLAAVSGIPEPLRGVAHGIELARSSCPQRERLWHEALASRHVQAEDAVVRSLARRFVFTPRQIIASVADAQHRADTDLFAAARAQCSDALQAVARKVVLRATWDDIVLPDDAMQQLRELCARVDGQARVLEDWGFARRLSRGLGTTALFAGGSGTGKTMAAEVIANALGLDLYRVDLARVISKYIGETEKNLERVFEAAEGSNAILLFDEADALFGKRSDVRDAHDRYANIEISYLLQRMEAYDGVAILATNLADHLDVAFTRRLAFSVYFPFPDEDARRELWRRSWPIEAPLDDSVDCRALARELRINGGNIRNIVLGAAYLAASEGRAITSRHVGHAVRREYQKVGRTSELAGEFLAGC